MKLEGRTQEILRDIRQRSLAHVLPVKRMVLGGIDETTQARILRAVGGLQRQRGVGLLESTAALDELVADFPEAIQPLAGDKPFEQQIAALEVELALLLAQNQGWPREDLL